MYWDDEVEEFTIYGIVDPRIQKFRYVGQTSDFQRRKRAYLDPKAENRAPEVPCGAITTWTHRIMAEGLTPLFVVLEIVETRPAALLSKADWVTRLFSADHPLLNSTREYQGNNVTINAHPRAWKSPDSKETNRANIGSAWTLVRDKELIGHYNRGAGAIEIASAVKRTRGGVRARLVRLGLISNRRDLRN